MDLQTIHDTGELGMRLYALTHDPLTFSAAKILLQTDSPKLTEPQENAMAMLRKQLKAYDTIFVKPLT